ncbi:MAG: glycosyltransferase family 4 protein [Desulfovibrionaceae bacterium]
MQRLVIIPEKWEHHIRQSCPDQILEHLQDVEEYDHPGPDLDCLPPMFFKNLGCVPNLRTAYGEPAFRREVALCARMQREQGTLYHFLNGESAVFLTPRHKGGNRIMATYHLPAAFMETIIPDKSHFPLHDAVVVVAPNQVEYFQGLAGADKVHFIPLGVEVDVFPFGPAEERCPRVLFVGNWLRDFPALVQATARINALAPEVEVVCVTPEANHPLFAGLDVDLRCNIPTADLLELYRTSSALLFPLADCTANTALLEAMCSGLPVVTNRMILDTGYLTEETAFLAPDGDGEAMADACIELARDEVLRARQSHAIRQWVTERFNWPCVAAMYARLYARLGLEVQLRRPRLLPGGRA